MYVDFPYTIIYASSEVQFSLNFGQMPKL